MKLFTIGYERRTQPELIEQLKRAEVRTLIDVRAVASSRRAGFSKTLLAAGLDEAGISYVHLRDLGAPKPGRIAARAGRTAEMLRIYEGHLEEPAAQLQLAAAGDIARAGQTALLCLEAEAGHCHRRVVADRLAQSLGLEVVDL
jgi:uncharacterized protein (DUF488 family)